MALKRQDPSPVTRRSLNWLGEDGPKGPVAGMALVIKGRCPDVLTCAVGRGLKAFIKRGRAMQVGRFTRLVIGIRLVIRNIIKHSSESNITK